jgi:hypothetical protein
VQSWDATAEACYEALAETRALEASSLYVDSVYQDAIDAFPFGFQYNTPVPTNEYSGSWQLAAAGSDWPAHAPAGDVYLYIPSDMWDQLNGPATTAANSWNTALGGLITSSVIEGDGSNCDGDGDCVVSQETYQDPLDPSCASTEGPASQTSAGLVTSPRFIDLPIDDGRDWGDRSDDRLVRIVHELGHVVGLGHSPLSRCDPSTSIMAQAPADMFPVGLLHIRLRHIRWHDTGAHHK